MFPVWLPFLLLASISFAASDAMRRLLGPQLNPLFVTLGSYFISALLAALTFLVFFKSELGPTVSVAKKLWPFFVINGIALAIGVTSHVQGFRLGANLSIATPIVVAGVAIFASIFGAIFFHEPLSLKWLVGIALTITGIALILYK